MSLFDLTPLEVIAWIVLVFITSIVWHGAKWCTNFCVTRIFGK